MQPLTTTSTELARNAHQEVVVRCPATGERVGAVPVTPRAETEAVAARLRVAQPAWRALGTQGRAKWLGQMARLVARSRRGTPESAAARIR
jgi:acyl-CoA reductase-like NAD-dependent aldehyde dehydrogenase